MYRFKIYIWPWLDLKVASSEAHVVFASAELTGMWIITSKMLQSAFYMFIISQIHMSLIRKTSSSYYHKHHKSTLQELIISVNSIIMASAVTLAQSNWSDYWLSLLVLIAVEVWIAIAAKRRAEWTGLSLCSEKPTNPRPAKRDKWAAALPFRSLIGCLQGNLRCLFLWHIQ